MVGGMNFAISNFEVFIPKVGNRSIGISIPVKLGLWDWWQRVALTKTATAVKCMMTCSGR